MKESKVKRKKIDMSAQAVTARIKHACQLGEVELLASAMRNAIAEITTGKQIRESIRSENSVDETCN